ncbi:glycoside hydrolase domain-containing protein [Epilithonimonas bovis]|uniref:glycoside hydrolase domain-containing protein n=1 Tax=Epilithonimonas bovis TaxID=421530 RepID=UPI0009FC0176
MAVDFPSCFTVIVYTPAFISNDVCMVYINDKLAFSNRVYNVVNQKWSIFSSAESTFKNINIKIPN